MNVVETHFLKKFEDEVDLSLVSSLGVEICQPLEDTLKISTKNLLQYTPQGDVKPSFF